MEVELKKEKSYKRKITNGSAKESAVLPVSTSSAHSQKDVLDDERAETTSWRAHGSVSKSKKGRGKQEVKLEHSFGERDDGKEEEKIYQFPLHRVKTIMKSENSDLRINQDALFLVNKATEKFLQDLCQEAYAYSAKDRKKSVAYNNLSSVVGKQKRYDFLSDFVPEKIKAEDAIAERQLAEAEASVQRLVKGVKVSIGIQMPKHTQLSYSTHFSINRRAWLQKKRPLFRSVHSLLSSRYNS